MDIPNHIQLLQWDQDVTLKNVDDFRMTIWKFMDGEKSKLILELTGVVYLNSAALGVIADAVLISGRHHKEIVIAGVQPTVNEILKIVHFSTFMKIFVQVEEAYNYYNRVKE
jgi:anti-sigma B factor antagonist